MYLTADKVGFHGICFFKGQKAIKNDTGERPFVSFLFERKNYIFFTVICIAFINQNVCFANKYVGMKNLFE